MKQIECHICGVCCTILSISTLSKKAGDKCNYLLESNKCSNYENRPKVCREYKADELCFFISTLKSDEQYQVFKAVYGERSR